MKALILILIIIPLIGISQSRDTIYADEYMEVISLDTTTSPSNYIIIQSLNSTKMDSIVEYLKLSDDLKNNEQLDSMSQLYEGLYSNWKMIKDTHFINYQKANNTYLRYYIIKTLIDALIP